jgi:hypothetical protein
MQSVIAKVEAPAGFAEQFSIRSFFTMKFFPRLAAGMMAVQALSFAAFAQRYTQVNLDSNVQGAAEAVDSKLINGWGLARSSNSAWWVSD